MKLCITAEGVTVDSRVDPRFGRCRYFIFFDTDTGSFEAKANPNGESASGAGIQAGQFVASLGVKVVLTGNMGPNAHQVLSAAGIVVCVDVSGTIQEAITGYQEGKFKPSTNASVGSKFGMPNI